jgi:hypothetical protein
MTDRVNEQARKGHANSARGPGLEPCNEPTPAVSVNPTPVSLLERLCRPGIVSAWKQFAELSAPCCSCGRREAKRGKTGMAT